MNQNHQIFIPEEEILKVLNIKNPNIKEMFIFPEISHPIKEISAQKFLILEKGLLFYEIYLIIVAKIFFMSSHPISEKNSFFSEYSNFKKWVKSEQGTTFLAKKKKTLENCFLLDKAKLRFQYESQKINDEDLKSLLPSYQFPVMFIKLYQLAETTSGPIPKEFVSLPKNIGNFSICESPFHNKQNLYKNSELRIIEKCCLCMPFGITDMKFHFMKTRKLDLAMSSMNSSPNIFYEIAYIGKNTEDSKCEEIIYETDNRKLLENSEQLLSKMNTFYIKKKNIPKKLLEAFIFIKCIGKGSYGEVFHIIDRHDKSSYALKLCRNIDQDSLNEIKTLEKLDHENVIKYYKCINKEEEGYIAIITELADCDLDYIIKNKDLTQNQMLDYTEQLFKGIFYLHNSKTTIHRDLKPGNILLILKDNKIKIADFGESKFKTSKSSTELSNTNQIRGTLAFLPPEGLKELDSESENVKINDKTDIWSLGVILHMLYTKGKHPFMKYTTECPFNGGKPNSHEVCENVKNGMLNIDESIKQNTIAHKIIKG